MFTLTRVETTRRVNFIEDVCFLICRCLNVLFESRVTQSFCVMHVCRRVGFACKQVVV